MKASKVRHWVVGVGCVVGLSACHPITGCGIGPLSVGMSAKQAKAAGFAYVGHEGRVDCGYYSSKAPNDSHVSGVGSARNLTWIETGNGSDRLSNGLGPGSTFGQIKAVHGSEVKVYFPDWDTPGNRALYVPVVIVRLGDNAITFEMRGDSKRVGKTLSNSAVVGYVKVSTWAARGDDEGCA